MKTKSHRADFKEPCMTKTVDNSVASDNMLNTYYSQIKGIQLLTFEEELYLSHQIQAGNEEAREKLIKANLRLVIKIAKQFSSQDIPLSDLIQEGNMGLMHAASKYHFDHNVRFSTYASWWIKQAISRSLANKRRMIRIPHRKEESYRKIQRASNVLTQINSEAPSIREIAKETSMSEKDVRDILSITNNTVSLDAEVGEESGTLLDVFEDYSYSPDQEVLKESVRAKTLEVLERLMEKEQEILKYRFEFYGGKKYTLKSIGEKMGMSPETVRQIEMRALRKLKMETEELQEYMYE